MCRRMEVSVKSEGWIVEGVKMAKQTRVSLFFFFFFGGDKIETDEVWVTLNRT